MGACFSKADSKETATQKPAEKGTASNGKLRPGTGTEPSTASFVNVELDKHERHATPTDTSDATTSLSEDPHKSGELNGRDERILIQGNSLNSTQDGTMSASQSGILDSTEGEDGPDKIAESPSSRRRRLVRGNSTLRTTLPSIQDNGSPATGTPADTGKSVWGDTLSVTEWDNSLAYKPFRSPDATAERERVSALKRLGLDYTSEEQSLDFITKLITNVFGCPTASICLIDGTRCYVKSTAGGPRLVKEIDRRIAISAHVLVPLKPEVLVVEDLTLDARFKDHPYVIGAPRIRFFAGAPLLTTSGHRIGTLAMHDFKPRQFDAESCNVLCNFAEMTMRELQRISESGFQRAVSWNPSPENDLMLRKIESCSDGVVLLDVRLSKWPVLFCNDGWSEITGLPPISGSLKNFWDMFQLPGVSSSRQPWSIYEGAVERGETFTLDVVLAGRSGKQLYGVTFKPATEDLDDGMVAISVPSRVASSQLGPHDRNFYFGTVFRGRNGSLSRSPSQSLAAQVPVPITDDEMKPPIPNVRLGPLLGKGSFGSVHYGTWNGAQIAVKVIQHMATEEERQARDEQLEAILGLKMLHPNIVRTFQFATKDRSGSRQGAMSERMRMDLASLAEEDAPAKMGGRKMMETWIVLELCNRGSLQEAIDKGAFRIKAGELNEGTPNMINILRTATEIAGAMTYLHSLDILHSDLNGNNILLISNTGIDDRPFSVKVSDFGLSRIHIGERTVATQTYGTVTHMPPELLAEGRLSKAADVYAFGVLLWEMLTGQRPWAGLRHVQIITRKMHAGTQLKWPPNVFKPFRDLAQRCMNPDSHQRPTFSQALEQLEPMREMAERGELIAYKDPTPKEEGMNAMLGQISAIEEGEETGHISSKGSK